MIENIFTVESIQDPINDYTTQEYQNDVFIYIIIVSVMITVVIGILWLTVFL